MSNAATADPSTREQLLIVAEQLLLENDYERVSVRAINAAAGMNAAAVHYHFGSKESLTSALLEWRLAPVWDGLLTELSRRVDHGEAPTVAELVDVVLTPLTELADDPVGRMRLQLLARMVLGSAQPTWASRWFRLDPWAELLRTTRLDLDLAEARRRWAFGFELILRCFGNPMADTPWAKDVSEASLATLRAFVIAGLDAPGGSH